MDNEEELRNKIAEAQERMLQEHEGSDDQQPLEKEADQQPDQSEQEESQESEESETNEEKSEIENDLDKEESDKTPQGKAFAALRREAKEAQQREQELRERLARLEGAQDAGKQEKQEEAKEEIPDKDVDPDAYYEYKLNQMEKRNSELEKKINGFSEMTEAQKAEKAYQDMEKSYTEKKDPNYSKAKEFLYKDMKRELSEKHPNVSESKINQAIKEQEYKIVSSLANAGLSENEIFMTLKGYALERGFKPEESSQEQKAESRKNLKRNVEKGASLNNVPSSGKSKGITERQLGDMKHSDFQKAVGDPAQHRNLQDAIDAARLKALES